jgi:SAM-dependent methyltransferase
LEKLRVIDKFVCQVCSADRLETVDLYSELPRVTSDCKPWPAGGKMAVCHACGAVQKLPDAAWLADIERIYKDYQIYELSSGSEQAIFNGDGGSSTRSRLLVDFIKKSAALPPKGKVIDIGCGNGGALRTFSEALPDWRLYGTELTDASLAGLKSLPNFVQLFTGDQPDIRERFDLVTMIHSLEHMLEPSKTLKDAGDLLTASGSLFVEIPDVETSPFDLIVADHLMHFSRATLSLLVERSGFAVQVLRNNLLPKENTLLAGRGIVSPTRPDAATGIALVKRNLKWLHAVVELATRTASSNVSFGLFGTSISGTWLYGAMREKIDFFVDEDETRIGRSVDGRPIIAPAEVPKNASVFIPLIPSVAEKVIMRLEHYEGCFVAPPALYAEGSAFQ